MAGAQNETGTVLNVGRNLFIERELLDVNREINKLREQVADTMRRLKVNFGEGIFEDTKKFISILPPVKKKNCIMLLQELNEGNNELKTLTDRCQEIQQELKLEREPYVIIKERIYPGAVLNIKKSVKKIDKVAENVKYYEDPEERSIRFTAAI